MACSRQRAGTLAALRWVDRPLGRYYLYFSHHAGKFIRLAYADALTGPWKVHEGGTAFSNLPAFCRVTAVLKPSSDSNIETELWLPAVQRHR